MKTTYRILYQPITTEYSIIELIVTPFGQGNTTTRQLTNEELSTWSRENFLEKMTESGYEQTAEIFLEKYDIKFKGDE